MSDDKCPIWGTPARFEPSNGNRNVNSPRAGGKYCISLSAMAELENKNWSDKEKVLLTNWLIEQRRLGNERPKVLSKAISGLEQMRPLSVFERADKLLRYLHSESELLGKVISFKNPSDTKTLNSGNEMLAWTASIKLSEVVTLSEYCKEMQWIEHRFRPDLGTIHELMLKPKGYARLAELDGTNINSKQAFVAMSFDPSMVEAYKQGIKLGIEAAGYDTCRVDEQDHNDKIDDKIIAGIRRSRFLVADFTQGRTGARGGVYYEAGFAHGLNIPVIFTCRKNAIKKVHFDTRQYNHIVWESYEELKEKLSQRISATIGDGPGKIR